MSDPREKRAKKWYMKIFFGDAELYKEFLGYYDEAIKDGSVEPESIAMIQFRDRWIETEDGWQER